MKTTVLAALCGVLAWSAPALAQTIDYDPRRPEVLATCDDHRYRGRPAEARQCYTALLRQARAPFLRAEIMWALGDVQRANDLFRRAVASTDRASHERVRWGRLYLETHQDAEALELFRESLEIDPGDLQAKLGMAHVFARRFEGEARVLIADVLARNDQLVDAHLLAARMSLEEGRPEEAEAALERAMELAADQKLPPLEAYALRAAIERQRGSERRSRRWIDRTLAYNPRYGAVFEQLAYFEIMRRRYREANELLERAVEVQPDLWSAHAELGANRLRLGDLDGGRRSLEIAYSGDPYSATTVNSLRLLDRLDQFEVSTRSVTVPGADQPVETRMRLHRDESRALEPYVAELLAESITTFAQRYDYVPREPVTVELFPDHDDFAVRVAALPGIGLLGVTFGHLVAMDSPAGRAIGDFHWGSTLWHELAHVFTLSITEHRVPRWLSEGVSVFEEWRTGPTPGVTVSPDVIAALDEGRFLPVSELDSGFIRPTYPNQVQVSYLQAGLICLFIDERWGFERLVTLLRRFTRDTTTAEAIEAVFRMEPEEFDEAFVEYVRQRYAPILDDMAGWQRDHQAARQAIAAQRWTDAIEPARRAAERYPEHSGPASPHILLARALDKTGRRAEAIESLRRYRRNGGWQPEALRELAAWLDEAGETAEATEILLSLNYLDPLNAAHHAALGDRLLAAGRAEEALREFQVLLALGPRDEAPARFGMARALRATGDATASRRYLLDALAIAPHYRPAQDLLLQMIEERK
ncbi:MAG: hypothetical protein DIU71_08265 [Proteobacteria bacterium]|nr:MAG: hypothetical protein DIU71_08265 [Pseudomonadota bacterium]